MKTPWELSGDMELDASPLEAIIEQISRRHHERMEQFLWGCVYDVMDQHGWKLYEDMPKMGRIITSQATRNAIGFLWGDQIVGCLTWNCPGGTYQTHDTFPFPYRP